MMKPRGRHTCVVCTGTACHIRGAGELLKAVAESAGVKAGETTPDGNLSILTARCFGTCGLAPVAVIDGETEGRLTPDLLKRLRQDGYDGFFSLEPHLSAAGQYSGFSGPDLFHRASHALQSMLQALGWDYA